MGIEWNVGDDAKQVAVAFALQHSIPGEELSSVVAFVKHASQLAAAQCTAKEVGEEPAQEPTADVKTDDGAEGDAGDESDKTEKTYHAEIEQLRAMGFEGTEALHALLMYTGGNIQKVIAF